MTYHNDEDCPCEIDITGRSCLDDIDDFIIDEECASGGDPLWIHAVTVVFVTDIFLAIVYQVKLHCHDYFLLF